MLPESGEILKQGFEVTVQPSRGYRLEGDRVQGCVDGLEAIRQAAYCILCTERYENVIYGWNYGVELRDLFGKSVGVVQSKIKKRITEALTQDDRIRAVNAFSFAREGRRLHVRFMICTDYGSIRMEKEVDF